MKTKPRAVPSWDAYLMAMARTAATRSRDPSTQHGCCIANERHVVLATGYNGPPAGIDDHELDWGRPAKYLVLIHAERNALDHAPVGDLVGCTLYVTGQPCPACMLGIAARRIRRVVYGAVPSAMVDGTAWMQALDIAGRCGIELVRFGEAV